MLCYLKVINLISLSFTEFLYEDERTNKKLIHYCCDDDVHQANIRFMANYRVYIE